MSIGGTRKDFWHLTPKTILIDFKAHSNRVNEQMQLAWLQGLYVKAALSSTVLACGLADKRAISQMPKYPDKPSISEQEQEQEMTDEEIKAQTQYFIAKMEHWRKTNNKKNN